MAVNGDEIIQGGEEESDNDDEHQGHTKRITGRLFDFLSGHCRSVGKDDLDGVMRTSEESGDGGDPLEKVSEGKAETSVCEICRDQAGRTSGQKVSGSGEHHVDDHEVDEEKACFLHVAGEGADGKKDQDRFPEDRLCPLESARGKMFQKILAADGDLQPENGAERKACQKDRDRDSVVCVHGEKPYICV